jgi:hypothetical protein
MLGIMIMSEFRADACGVGGLFVEGLAVPDTAAHELRPGGNRYGWNHFFGEQRP